MLAELVLADLERGQQLISKVHPDPIDPQFRIASPEADAYLLVAIVWQIQHVSISRRSILRSHSMIAGGLCSRSGLIAPRVHRGPRAPRRRCRARRWRLGLR